MREGRVVLTDLPVSKKKCWKFSPTQQFHSPSCLHNHHYPLYKEACYLFNLLIQTRQALYLLSSLQSPQLSHQVPSASLRLPKIRGNQENLSGLIPNLCKHTHAHTNTNSHTQRHIPIWIQVENCPNLNFKMIQIFSFGWLVRKMDQKLDVST